MDELNGRGGARDMCQGIFFFHVKLAKMYNISRPSFEITSIAPHICPLLSE